MSSEAIFEHGYEIIDLVREYDARYAGEDVHYETFARLANFFGRDMRPHWHDRYFQLHYLSLDALLYSWMSTSILCAHRFLY